MDIVQKLSGENLANLHKQVDAFNAGLNSQRTYKQNLDKDDFLKILITQLQHQDPTKPMEDREFIAQMAQFSSLEQITNMGRQFSDLSSILKRSQAMNLIGRVVEVPHQDSMIQGTVEAVTGGNFPQVQVNGVYYDYDEITRVME